MKPCKGSIVKAIGRLPSPITCDKIKNIKKNHNEKYYYCY